MEAASGLLDDLRMLTAALAPLRTADSGLERLTS